jgi:hypothetical protein
VINKFGVFSLSSSQVTPNLRTYFLNLPAGYQTPHPEDEEDSTLYLAQEVKELITIKINTIFFMFFVLMN